MGCGGKGLRPLLSAEPELHPLGPPSPLETAGSSDKLVPLPVSDAVVCQRFAEHFRQRGLTQFLRRPTGRLLAVRNLAVLSAPGLASPMPWRGAAVPSPHCPHDYFRTDQGSSVNVLHLRISLKMLGTVPENFIFSFLVNTQRLLLE